MGYANAHSIADVYENNFSQFNEVSFALINHLSANAAELFADCLTAANGMPTDIVCALMPALCDADYLNFLRKFLRAADSQENIGLRANINKLLPSKDYAADILYGFFWLEKGSIATEFNRQRVIRFAEEMSILGTMNPITQGMSEVEHQEVYQNAFNKVIKDILQFKKTVILSGINQAKEKTVVWRFFRTDPSRPSLPKNRLADENLIQHILSFT